MTSPRLRPSPAEWNNRTSPAPDEEESYLLTEEFRTPTPPWLSSLQYAAPHADELGPILPHEHGFVVLRTWNQPGSAQAETSDIVVSMTPLRAARLGAFAVGRVAQRCGGDREVG
ncbi:MAG TPA: hypothetical protein VFR47_19060 [Anaerolineales bacterium]|nr:hypothetical protein [Anaerolineales bacterium]